MDGYASSKHLLAFPFNVMRVGVVQLLHFVICDFVAVIAETKLKS